MTQSLKFLIDANSDQAVAQIQKAVAAVFGLGNATLSVNKNASDAYRQVQAATDALAGATAAAADRVKAAYDQQRAALDPLYASSQRYASVLQTVDAALDAQVISQAEANRMLALAETRYLAVDKAAGIAGKQTHQFSVQTGQVGGSSRNMGFMVQNAAFQISDFAVQVGMGTSAMRAAGQQLPQLLGGFGVWGAVIGGAVAVLGALIPALLNTGKNADDAGKRLSDLGAALDAYTQHAQLAGTSTDDLQKKFGAFAAEMRADAQWLTQVNLGQANAALKDDAAGLAASLDDVAQAQDKAAVAARYYIDTMSSADSGVASAADVKNARDQFLDLNDKIDAVANTMGLTAVQAFVLRDALKSMDGAKSMTDIQTASQGALDTLRAMFPAGQAVPKVIADIVDKLSKVHDQATLAVLATDKMPKSLGDAALSASGLADWLAKSWTAADGIAAADMAGGISAAIGPAQSLAGYLAAAASSAWDAAGARRTALDPTSTGYLANQYGQYGAGHAAMDAATDPLYNPPVPPVTRSGGSAGGSGPSDPVTDLGKSGADALKAMEDAVAGVNEKVSLGLMSTAEGANAITDAKEKAANALAELLPQIEALGTPAAQAFADSWRTKIKDMTDGISAAGRALSKSMSDDFATSFASFISGTASGKDAFKSFTQSVLADIAKIISQRITNNFITPMIDGVLGGFGGGAAPAAMPHAKGGAYTEFFAKGGMPLPSLRAYGNTVVDRPTFFSLGGARRGVMGEAGAEAILPLSRGRDGKLGVASGGAGGVQVNVKVEGVPAGHSARVEHGSSGGDQSIRIIIEQVDKALASMIGSGQSAAGSVMADTYGLNRKPR